MRHHDFNEFIYDSGKNEVLLVKIGAMDLQLDPCFGKGFKASNPKSHSFEMQKIFHVKFHKVLHEANTYFQILRNF